MVAGKLVLNAAFRGEGPTLKDPAYEVGCQGSASLWHASQVFIRKILVTSGAYPEGRAVTGTLCHVSGVTRFLGAVEL